MQHMSHDILTLKPTRKRPLLLDLFSGAGGAGMGYYRAGFDVVGVDLHRQKNYPFGFIQADVMAWLPAAIESGEIERFAVIHASPPCELDSAMSKRWGDKRKEHPDLIQPVRELLIKSKRPYVIENVAGARHKFDSHLMLCGTMFGLQTKGGNQLQRHRYFEIHPHILILQPPCSHNGQHPKRRRSIGVYGNAGGSSARDGVDFFGIDARRDVMEIDWMTNSEIVKAIPPAYTEFIGRKMLEMIAP